MKIQLRNLFSSRMPTSLALRKAVPGRPLLRGRTGSAGVPSSGHASHGFPRNPRELSISSLSGRYRLPRETEGRRGWMVEQSYRPILPMKVENRRAPARGGHGIHWREGGARGDASGEGNIIGTQSPLTMSTQLARLSTATRGRGAPCAVVSPPDEPAAGNPHGGLCEEGGLQWRHGGPTRARSRKRRIEPRNTYSPLRPPLLGGLVTDRAAPDRAE